MHRTTPALFSIVVLSLCCALDAAGQEEEETLELLDFDELYRIVVLPEVRTVVGNSSDLVEPCATKAKIGGCTTFVARRLDCLCEREEGQWRMRPRAQYLPAIYLADLSAATHERAHILDLRDSVAAYLLQLTERRFDTLVECRNAGRTASAEFRNRIDGFLRASNCRRHPSFAAAEGMCNGSGLATGR